MTTFEDVLIWRAQHNLSQQQMADLLGVQVLAVKRWEYRQRTPPQYLRLALERLDQLLAEAEAEAQAEEAIV